MKQPIKYMLLTNLAIMISLAMYAQSPSTSPLAKRVVPKASPLTPQRKAMMDRQKNTNFAQQHRSVIAATNQLTAQNAKAGTNGALTPNNATAPAAKPANFTENSSSELKSKLNNNKP
ncbi:MAG: hypothetical protein LCH51_01340 [Bacteroidetes bacterium]|nr:hypothetical protein [Bacteroidota bacterium]HOA38392.1 hypothetical protein [Flavihumibacter sp.]